ncbi:Nramp family divalent metal transporter [Leptospira ilyithenensis]|uniref:Divalent metal cation transporter n=1 Tax=Leptospira ilyithenensis TaxID=2484901 RepID=A0A4R9LSJ6_9LEPT|nr:Nramp family divalent metal transporter [Leptospira ilyithenensis]TGN10384.1 divalent metal cation transporter [Leptospira ilyithenensis]
MSKLQTFLKYFGPGLMYAGAAVGVSHLVQSTRAGAVYGYELLGVVIFANIIKFPFFEIGTRYTIVTGKSLLDGYQNLGRWPIWIFFIISFGTMCVIVATVTLVTSGLFATILGVEIQPWLLCAIILSFCFLLLAVGKYSALDKLMKWIVIGLTLTTILAVFFSFFANVPKLSTPAKSFSLSDAVDVSFLIALMGWMPIPIEAAVWQSDWTLAKKEQNGGELPPMKWALLDFHIGYWGTTVLAIFFLILGSNMMYNTGGQFSTNAVTFASELIRLYTSSLGSWAYPIILLAAFFTMFSTTLTCFDAYPRVVANASQRVIPRLASVSREKLYWIWIVVVALGSVGILAFFLTSMKGLVDFATTASFLNAPILALIHHLILFGKDIPKEHRPSPFVNLLSWFGIVFLFGFSIYFLQVRFFS